MSSRSLEFRRLHGGGLLILPNVWDGGTARLVERAGARALATTSAGVAWSHGYPDGDAIDVDALATTVEAIGRATRLPLSVDIEGGYSTDAATVGETVAYLASLGAVGVNVEDGNDTPQALCEKIASIKERAPDVFVNARTDVYLKGLVPPGERLGETLAREALYRAAGADGIFVPGLTDAAEIGRIVAGVLLPVNVLARPGLPNAAALRELGVRRLSAGSWLTSNVYGRVAALASGFLEDGESAPLFEGAMPYAEMNKLIAER